METSPIAGGTEGAALSERNVKNPCSVCGVESVEGMPNFCAQHRHEYRYENLANPEAKHVRIAEEDEVVLGKVGKKFELVLVMDGLVSGEETVETFYPYRVLLNVPAPGFMILHGIYVGGEIEGLQNESASFVEELRKVGVAVGGKNILTRQAEDAYNYFLHEVQRQELEWHLRGRRRHKRLGMPVMKRGDHVRVTGEMTGLVPQGYEFGTPFRICAYVEGTDRL